MKRFILFLLASFALVACSAPVVAPMITLDSGQSAHMTISEAGESFDISFTSATEWDAEVRYSESSGWVILDRTSGVGEYASEKINVTVQENVSDVERTATIVISSGEISKEILLTQNALGNVFDVLEDSADVGAEGGTVKATVRFNVEYECKIGVDWITEVDTKSYEDKVHTFIVAPNESTEARNTTISFCGNGTCLPFVVNQAGVSADGGLSADKESIAVPYSGTSTPVVVNVTSNMVWTVKSNSDWCSIIPPSGTGNGHFKVSVSKNTAAESRNAVITLASQENPSVFCEILVNQEAKPQQEIDDSWKTAEFEHRSLFMRFTADWCGYCPIMATSAALAQESMPGKIEVLSVHGGGSGLACSASASLVSHYKVSGFPSGLVDCKTWIDNGAPDKTSALIVKAVNDLEAKYDTFTGASWTSDISGTTVSLDLVTYIKKSGSYKVTALLVEDKIVGYQADYENGTSYSYTHNGVVRGAFSSALGESLSLNEDKQVKRFNYSLKIPSGCNKNNLKVVVYIQRSDNGSYYVDNVAAAKVGEDMALAVL